MAAVDAARADWTVLGAGDFDTVGGLLERVEENRPDLIITDIIMPEKEGVETIIALRRADPDLPIIAISGGGRLDATDFLTMAGKLGARRTLSKPFRRDQLLEAVGECLAEDEA
ncbi:MAG: response regulator [Proteobacteria bacterium]|nr:response regulator [Pseudomonadota bacterium]